MERIFEFPSPEAAEEFAGDARPAGWRAEFPAGATVIGLVLGGIALGLIGWLADAGLLGVAGTVPGP